MAKKCGIKIKVTQEHIDEGEPGSATSCAIALALQEAFGGDVPIDVNGNVQVGSMFFHGDKKVQQFVSNFDEAGYFDRDIPLSKLPKEDREDERDARNQYKKARPFTLYLSNGKAIAG